MKSEKERMYQLHAEICKAMGNPHRLALLDALRHGEKAVGDLAEELGLTVSNTSQHLSVLKAAGIVKRRKDGTTCYYRVATEAIFDAFDCMGRIMLEGHEEEAEHLEYLKRQETAVKK